MNGNRPADRKHHNRTESSTAGPRNHLEITRIMKPLIDIPTYHWSKPTAGDYTDFLRSKVKLAKDQGVTCQPGECNPRLKPHQQLIVEWMVKGGRRACFASFGLGNSVIQLETVRLVLS